MAFHQNRCRLEAALKTMLAKRPEDRFASMDLAVAEFERCLMIIDTAGAGDDLQALAVAAKSLAEPMVPMARPVAAAPAAGAGQAVSEQTAEFSRADNDLGSSLSGGSGSSLGRTPPRNEPSRPSRSASAARARERSDQSGRAASAHRRWWLGGAATAACLAGALLAGWFAARGDSGVHLTPASAAAAQSPGAPPEFEPVAVSEPASPQTPDPRQTLVWLIEQGARVGVQPAAGQPRWLTSVDDLSGPLPDPLAVELPRTGEPAAILHRLPQLPGLVTLMVSNANLSDAMLAALTDLPKLRVLHINAARVTDAGLDHLQSLQSLRRLHLRGVAVTADGVARLQQALPRCVIMWPGAGAKKQPKAQS